MPTQLIEKEASPTTATQINVAGMEKLTNSLESLLEKTRTATQQTPVELSPELLNLLKSLAEDDGSSTTEILSKGLVLIGVAIKAKEKGLRLGIADAKGNLVREIIGF